MKAVLCSQNSHVVGIAASIPFISVLGKLDRSTYRYCGDSEIAKHEVRQRDGHGWMIWNTDRCKSFSGGLGLRVH